MKHQAVNFLSTLIEGDRDRERERERAKHTEMDTERKIEGQRDEVIEMQIEGDTIREWGWE